MEKYFSDNLYVEPYVGKKGLDSNPHIKITDKRLKNKKFKLNLMYYFKSDMSGLYLILKIPYNKSIRKKYGNEYYINYLQNKSTFIRQFLEENNKIKEGVISDIDLAIDMLIKTNAHKKATIIAKYYEKGKVPSTEELLDDIKYFLDLRWYILENFQDKMEVSVNEWMVVLEDNSIIDNKMFNILEIMYHLKNYKATTGQLIEERKKLGFINEKSYNSTIINNSKRVKEFFNKSSIFNDDGSENYWMRFFYGQNIYVKRNGEKVKAFEFKLKDELVKAFKKVNRTTLNDEIHADITNAIEESKQVEIMEKEILFNSFYDYLIEKEFLFDKETIENYLLSLKVKPFAILTGNSGTGKTKLSQLFAQYLNSNLIIDEQKNYGSNKFTASVKVGKSAINRGWAIPREDSVNLIPKMKCEEPFPVLIDGVPAKGKINFNVRFFYKPEEELVNHLNELAEKDPNQRITLELDAPTEDINNFYVEPKKSLSKDSAEYITFKTRSSYLNKDFFGLGSKTLIALLGLEKYQGTLDFYFDDIKSTEYITVNTVAGSRDKKLVNHLESVDDLSDIVIKINKEDFENTFLNIETESKSNVLSFSRKKGKHNFWSLPRTEIDGFVPIKHTHSWRAIVDGIETTIDFWIHDAIFAIDNSENEVLKKYISKKSENDMINFKVDFSTFKQVTYNSDLGVEFLDDQTTKNTDNSNYKIIPVGANWTENRHIVGYYNVITNEYQDTPAYKLINQASTSTEPHFLILDEMNLSHVERYFADFLSAIESGEKIPLYGEEELTLPPNLFIIGTVNVDETTYMFSPKVLDRANVIEFETYSAADYMNKRINLRPPSGNIKYLEDPLAGNDIREKGIDELRELFTDVKADGESFWNILTDEIYGFQKILKESGFDFGFRVINEIVRFMAVAWEYENNPTDFSNWKRYFDACIKQKLLPKLHGSEKIIGETLDKLYAKCLDNSFDSEETAKYPESYKKLKEMREVLRKQRYVSFIN